MYPVHNVKRGKSFNLFGIVYIQFIGLSLRVVAVGDCIQYYSNPIAPPRVNPVLHPVCIVNTDSGISLSARIIEPWICLSTLL